MILLDTNVVSEAFRPRPNPAVVAWLNEQPAAMVYICTPVLAELHYGVERLPPGSRASSLRALISKMETEGFQDRILSFDTAGADAYGRIKTAREKLGRSIQVMDALIAAIALTHGASLATRNLDDFADIGLDLINPFELANARR